MDGDVYWGIAGSSYCKNMTYDGCMLSRFDAHAGIYNGKIINSTINAVEIIGGGTHTEIFACEINSVCAVENCRLHFFKISGRGEQLRSFHIFYLS